MKYKIIINLLIFFSFANYAFSVDLERKKETLLSNLQESLTDCKKYLDETTNVPQESRNKLVKALSQIFLFNSLIYSSPSSEHSLLINIDTETFYIINDSLIHDPRYYEILQEFFKPYYEDIKYEVCHSDIPEKDVFKIVMDDNVSFLSKVNCIGLVTDKSMLKQVAAKYLFNFDYYEEENWFKFFDDLVGIIDDTEILKRALEFRKKKTTNNYSTNSFWACHRSINSLGQ